MAASYQMKYLIQIFLTIYLMLLNSLLKMINNILLISRSISFWLNLVISVLLFGPIAFFAGIVSYSVCLKISKLWCRYNLYFLKLFCSLSYTYDGPWVNSSQLIISKHQSAWETLFLAAYAEKPIFILKKAVSYTHLTLPTR